MRIRLLLGHRGALGLASPPQRRPAAKPKAYFCGAVKTTTLLWPHGHKTLRSFHVPAAHTPNIQVYRYDPNFAGGNLLLYADARGSGAVGQGLLRDGPFGAAHRRSPTPRR